MRCTACQHDNDPGTKFCEECGIKLLRVCSSCGIALKPTANYCPECGASTVVTVPTTQPPTRRVADYTPKHLADRIFQSCSALEGERKTITALFADLKGSTALVEGLDPEVARAVIDPALQIMMDAVHRYEGYVAQALGDGILALFGVLICT